MLGCEKVCATSVVGGSLLLLLLPSLSICGREHNAIVAVFIQPSSRDVRFVATSRAATNICHLSPAFNTHILSHFSLAFTRFLSHLSPAYTRFLSHLSPVLITESDYGIGFLIDASVSSALQAVKR